MSMSAGTKDTIVIVCFHIHMCYVLMYSLEVLIYSVFAELKG